MINLVHPLSTGSASKSFICFDGEFLFCYLVGFFVLFVMESSLGNVGSVEMVIVTGRA